MPTARIATFYAANIVLAVDKIDEQLRTIEDVYRVRASQFRGKANGVAGTTTAVFEGLEQNIREFILEEEGVDEGELHKFMGSVTEKEVPFWSLAVLSDYLVQNGWYKRISASSKADLIAQRAKTTFMKYSSPNKAVCVEIPVFFQEPEEINVYVLDNEGSDFTPGEQFKMNPVTGQFDFVEIVNTAEKFLLIP